MQLQYSRCWHLGWGASVAPAIGIGFGQLGEMGASLVGLASMGGGNYPTTNAYVGSKEGRAYYMVGTANPPQDVGDLNGFAAQVQAAGF